MQVNYSKQHFRYMMFACHVWYTLSLTIYMASSLMDGVILSVCKCSINIQNPTTMQLNFILNDQPSKEVVIHAMEIFFRFTGMWIVYKFAGQFHLS